MHDETEAIRRQEVAEINADFKSGLPLVSGFDPVADSDIQPLEPDSLIVCNCSQRQDNSAAQCGNQQFEGTAVKAADIVTPGNNPFPFPCSYLGAAVG